MIQFRISRLEPALAVRLDAERGFLADPAHELRTPIAALTASVHQVIAAPDDVTRRAAATRLDQRHPLHP